MNLARYFQNYLVEILMKGKSIFVFSILFVSLTFAQDKITLYNLFTFNNKTIHVNKDYVSSNKDTLSFENIKLYVSNFEIIYTDNSSEKQKNSYHLLDYEKPETLYFELNRNLNKKIKAIKFGIGIDSLTNVSGAMGDDLDATKGMYWAWQSGYINLKIEGKSSSCKTRKNKFQFHIGGYLQPYCTYREIEFLVDDRKEYYLNFNLENLFSKIDLKILNTIMTPSKEAIQFSDFLEKVISVE